MKIILVTTALCAVCMSAWAVPSRVTTLTTVSSTAGTVTFSWTEAAPTVGFSLISNDVRIATFPITTLNFSSAVNISLLVGNPGTPGTPQTATVNGLTPNTAYWIALKGQDGTGWSKVSNVAVATTTARNTTVTLAWNAPTNVYNLQTYKLCYGTSSGNYTVTNSVGNVTLYSIDGFTPGTTYYFAAMYADADGEESPFSNEVQWTAPTQ